MLKEEILQQIIKVLMPKEFVLLQMEHIHILVACIILKILMKIGLRTHQDLLNIMLEIK